MSERTRRYVELIAVAMIAAAFSAAAPAIAHGVRHALFAHKAGDAAKLGGKLANKYALKQTLSAPGTINALGNPMDWTKLKGVPGGFADGSDNIGPGVADDLECAGCVASADLANDAVTSAKIDDGAVSEADLSFDPATQAELAALEDRVEELEDKLAAVSYDNGADLLTISGANVRIVDGSGTTDGVTNGLGNLIIGYNTGGSETRTGSHNLVIGDDHTYSSYGGIVAGQNNAITAPSASVTGGGNNSAVDAHASVTGGLSNTAGGQFSSVTGGANNTAGHFGAVTGGANNTASGGQPSSVSGGNGNTASGWWSSVSGGTSNTASGQGSSVTGGSTNTASGQSSSVSGGFQNIADALHRWLGGTLAVRTASVTVTGAGDTEGNGSYDSAATQVLCAADEQFMGGGAYWDIDDGTKELNFVYARHITVGAQTGWRVRGGNDTSADHLLTIQAFCLGD